MSATNTGQPGNPVFTVFTATYNRLHTLQRVYDSLKAQTFRDFEWLIVDDGSSDGSAELIKSWEAEGQVKIRYYFQTNKGKHFAWNRGVQLAEGELFLSLDSDDACKPEALQTFHAMWLAIDEARRPEFTGACCLCVDQHGKLSGDLFPQDILDASSLELKYKYKIAGEKWGFHRTQVLREFPFPELPGVRYVPETIVWCRIARRYKERFFNKILRIHYEDEVAVQALTGNAPWKNSPGLVMASEVILNEEIDWFFYDPLSFIRAATNVCRVSKHAGIGLVEQYNRLSGFFGKALWFCCMPLAWGYYWSDMRRKNAMDGN